MIRIRHADAYDAAPLSALVERSKAHWGYAPELMELWRHQGHFNLTTELILNNQTRVAEHTETHKVLGFSLLHLNDRRATLEDLFVDAPYIGSELRVGSVLLNDATHQAKRLGAETVQLCADPHAVGFYEKYGFTVVNWSSVDPQTNRSLPILHKALQRPSA